MRVDERVHDSELRLRVQELLDLVLPEAPTTGYGWVLVASGEPVCRLEEDDFVPPSTTAPGASGRHRWTFRAIREGRTAIELHYARAFETTPPARLFRVRVAVD